MFDVYNQLILDNNYVLIECTYLCFNMSSPKINTYRLKCKKKAEPNDPAFLDVFSVLFSE